MAMMINSPSFHALMQSLEYQFETRAEKVHTTRWQGMDVSKKPDMATRELLNVTMSVSLPDIYDLEHYRLDIKPNLPWADDHFKERVCGEPLNPGKTWRSWPWSLSADKFRSTVKADPCVQVPEGTEEEPIFNHTYMERYWPRYAGRYTQGEDGLEPNKGIRHQYGDMMSLVLLLAHEPDTRQAYIPIFFPEDTGVGDGGRKPCTLGYHFIVRGGRLHVYYPMRSCDIVRHLRDDIYLTVRLLLWVLDKCRGLNPQAWRHITPGTYTMHCTSLHMFENDWTAFIKRRTS